jgi:hypothetical protein
MNRLPESAIADTSTLQWLRLVGAGGLELLLLLLLFKKKKKIPYNCV